MNAAARLGRAWLPPVVFGAGVLVVWEVLLAVTDPEGFVLPPPTDIAAAVGDDWSIIWQATKVSGYVIVTGLAIGIVVGVVGALLVTRFRTANETLTPLAIAVNAIPIIALAPIFNTWIGLTKPESNQAVVVLLVFFPVFINTAKGLTQVGEDQVELMRSYAASEWTIVSKLRVPHALPYFFTALKIVSSLAVIAAIVAEYFGGRQDALGPIITQNAGLARYDTAWAAVLAGSVIGIGLYGLAVLAERLVMPWHHSNSAETPV